MTDAIPNPEEFEDGGADSSSKGITDLFRRALMTGIGSVFMTEDAIRRTLSEMKMPKEAIGYVVAQADKTKKDLVGALARELRSFLDDLEIQELVAKGMEGKTLEVTTRIRLVRDPETKKTKLETVGQNVAVERDPKKPKRRRRRKKSDAMDEDSAGSE